VKAVIQRVTHANIRINEQQHAEMGLGLVVLLGITHDDTHDDSQWLATKIAGLRIFNDTTGVMNLSLGEVSGEILIVSQFTLHASTKKGNRPSYIAAARPELAIPLYEHFIGCLQTTFPEKVLTGTFGAHMDIALTNSGPVTIIIDTKNKI
jgi:D-aminoacyl-tRNA deacylase